MTVEALRRRRPSTLADLLEAYGRELQAMAYLILRDRLEAEDVVIETLLTAFERGGDIRDERALGRGCCEWPRTMPWGGGGRPRVSCALEITPDPAAGGDLASESVTRLSLLDGVDRLPTQMRAALVLRYYADLSVEDVAAALGKSPNTIKAQLQTALDRLREHLAEPIGTSLGEARRA